MSDLADRHSGTLGGRLLKPADGAPSVVSVHLEPETARDVAVQHTAWMLTNLLARLVDVVSEIRITGADAPIHARVIPFLTSKPGLKASLIEAGTLIAGVPVAAGQPSSSGIALTVGPGEAGAGLRVYGEGFCGAISRGGLRSVGDSSLPFGPYVAACLAASEVFRHVRLRPDLYVPTDALSLSAWDYKLGPGTLSEVGLQLPHTEIEFGLAGAGAVGSAVLHSIWACPNLSVRAVITDSDPGGVDATNLNRCVIFNARHIGEPKASTAADVLSDSEIAWFPADSRYTRKAVAFVPRMLVSAVDTNRSRNQLQQEFWPARLFAASTKDLRAEVVRCGPPSSGPCLRCYNPPEIDLPDGVARERLRKMDDEALGTFAAEIFQPLELLRRWAAEGGCGEVGDAALEHVREAEQGPALFSVGFVSVLAGTLLAAEVVKEHLGCPSPLDDFHQNAKFQFWRPSAPANGRPQPLERDPNCPACATSEFGVEIWHSRATAWQPPSVG